MVGSNRSAPDDDRASNIQLSYIGHAIEAYDPEDETSHELVLSLLSGAKVFMRRDGNTLPAHETLVRALGSLLLKDEDCNMLRKGKFGGRWDEVVEATLLLMRCNFDSQHDAPHSICRRSWITDTSYNIAAVLQYVRALKRRSKLDDPRWPGDLFAYCISTFWVHDQYYPRDGKAIEFVRAVAGLPRESFSAKDRDSAWSEDLYKWVQEAAGPRESPSDDRS